MTLYELPRQARFDGEEYGLNTDFRVILKILQVLEEPVLPEVLSWVLHILISAESSENGYIIYDVLFGILDDTVVIWFNNP